MEAAAARTGSDLCSPPSGIRRGPGHWLSSYLAMLRFDIASQRTWLPMFVLTQVLFGTGMAIIYGFYLGSSMSPAAALFIVSGAPALAVITGALIGVTSMVTERYSPPGRLRHGPQQPGSLAAAISSGLASASKTGRPR